MTKSGISEGWGTMGSAAIGLAPLRILNAVPSRVAAADGG